MKFSRLKKYLNYYSCVMVYGLKEGFLTLNEMTHEKNLLHKMDYIPYLQINTTVYIYLYCQYLVLSCGVNDYYE